MSETMPINKVTEHKLWLPGRGVGEGEGGARGPSSSFW